MDPLPDRRHAWLRRELLAWQAEGLVTPETAAAIGARYSGTAGGGVVRLLLGLGGALLGVGTIWLVAANVDVDEVGPLARFLAVAALWLGSALAAEALDGPRAPETLAGALRLLSATAFGAAVFQAAQSLQVPAYEPDLLAAWAAGALAFAYATRSRPPLLVGAGAAVGWWTWVLVDSAGDGGAVVLGLGLTAPALLALAAVHERGTTRRPFAAVWRALGVVLGLGAAFVAALPWALEDAAVPGAALVVGLGVLAGTAAVAARSDDRLVRFELAGSAAAVLVLMLLVAVAPDAPDPSRTGAPDGAAVAYALAATAVFLVLAVGAALLGAVREQPGLTNTATVALVVLVVLQSFGLFATLLSGAGLALTVGAVLLAAGLAADRGRRRLLREEAS